MWSGRFRITIFYFIVDYPDILVFILTGNWTNICKTTARRLQTTSLTTWQLSHLPPIWEYRLKCWTHIVIFSNIPNHCPNSPMGSAMEWEVNILRSIHSSGELIRRITWTGNLIWPGEPVGGVLLSNLSIW